MSIAPTSNHIQRLLPRHFNVIEMAAAGHDVVTIAKTLDMSTHTISGILRSPLAQAELARRRKELRETEVLGMDRDATLGKARSILEQASERAATVSTELLECPNPTIALKAANSILDRVFGKGSDDRRSMVVNITAEHVDLLNLALKESHATLLPTNGSDSRDPQERQEHEVDGPEQLQPSDDGPSTDGTVYIGEVDVQDLPQDGSKDG